MAARHAKLLCAWRRRARAAGGEDRWEEERAARLVCQGVLSEIEAQDALALVIAGRERMDAAEIGRALVMASTALASAIVEERRRRDALEAELRAAVREMMRARQPAGALLDRVRALNADAGRVFVWPELRRFVEWEAARFLRARGGIA